MHGEAAAQGEVVAPGCEDGVMLHKDGEFGLDRPGPEIASPADGTTVDTGLPTAQCHVAAVTQRCAQPDAGRLVAGLRVDEVYLAVTASADGDPGGAS
ncbi:hypothetical protein ACW69H_10640 [Streptomyces sp. SS10]